MNSLNSTLMFVQMQIKTYYYPEMGYKQSLGLEFTLVFLSFKSSVRHTVSPLLVDQFSKPFDSPHNQDKMKSVPIF